LIKIHVLCVVFLRCKVGLLIHFLELNFSLSIIPCWSTCQFLDNWGWKSVGRFSW